MKKMNLRKNIYFLAKKSRINKRKLDYYFLLPSGKLEYAFTRNFCQLCYDTCKAGIPLHHILYKNSKRESFMNMVKYLNFMMPYFVEYYELEYC